MNSDEGKSEPARLDPEVARAAKLWPKVGLAAFVGALLGYLAGVGIGRKGELELNPHAKIEVLKGCYRTVYGLVLTADDFNAAGNVKLSPQQEADFRAGLAGAPPGHISALRCQFLGCMADGGILLSVIEQVELENCSE